MSTTTYTAHASVFVQLRGSGNVLPLIQAIGDQYMTEHPTVGLPLQLGGSARGYKSVLDGTTDIGMVSGAMAPAMTRLAHKQGQHLTTTPIARDGLYAIVQPSNPLRGLSLDQLAEVFAGRITDWSEFGGPKSAINVYVLPPSNGTYESWVQLVLRDKWPITLKAKIVFGSQIVSRVLADPQSIGFSSAAYADGRGVGVLAINGIEPDKANIGSRQYPLVRELSLVTRDKIRGEVTEFVRYCADAGKGQHIIASMGLVPIAAGKP